MVCPFFLIEMDPDFKLFIFLLNITQFPPTLFRAHAENIKCFWQLCWILIWLVSSHPHTVTFNRNLTGILRWNYRTNHMENLFNISIFIMALPFQISIAKSCHLLILICLLLATFHNISNIVFKLSDFLFKWNKKAEET